MNNIEALEECTEPLPANMHVYSARFGGHAVASCLDCQYLTVYWECACELEHDCKNYREEL